MPIELSVSALSIAIESSITILEASFTLIYDVYSKGVTYDDCHLPMCNVYSRGHSISRYYIKIYVCKRRC